MKKRRIKVLLAKGWYVAVQKGTDPFCTVYVLL